MKFFIYLLRHLIPRRYKVRKVKQLAGAYYANHWVIYDIFNNQQVDYSLMEDWAEFKALQKNNIWRGITEELI